MTDGTIGAMGPPTRRALAYPQEVLVGTNVLEHMHPDDVETVGISSGGWCRSPWMGAGIVRTRRSPWACACVTPMVDGWPSTP